MTFLYSKMSRLYRYYFRNSLKGCFIFTPHPVFPLVVLFIMTVSMGCAEKTKGVPDQSALQTTRKENSKTEIDALINPPQNRELQKQPEGPVTFFRPLTLKDAISFALTHNIDAAVQKLERDIQEEASVSAKFKMLPSLTVDGTLSRRDTYDASSSDPLFTEGQEDFNYSRNKTTLMANAELSWDLIDFGISYYQNKQAQNRISIVDQQRKRVIQNLRFNITKTFWEIQVSKQSMDMAKKLIGSLTELEKTLKNQMASQTTSQMDALETAAALSEMKLKLSEFEYEFKRGKTQLAMLMGLPEKTIFEIKDADFDIMFEESKIDIESLEKEALNNRPELYEQDIEELITLDEARIAAIEKFPKTSLFYRYDYDKDPHLYYDQWQTAGIRLSFDLLSLPEKQSREREVLLRRDLVKKKRLSVAAAVLTQLNLSVIDFQEATRTYDYVKEIAENRKRIVSAHKQYADSGVGIWEDVIKNEVKYLFAHSRRLKAYADMIVAEQRIMNTIGRNLDRKDHLFLYVTEKNPKTATPEKTTKTVKHIPTVSTVPMVASTATVSTAASLSTKKGEKAVEPAPTVEPLTTEKTKKKIDTVATKNTGEKRPYTLQLASYQSIDKAMEMLPFYEKKGLSPYIVKMNPIGKGERFRCYAGLYRLPTEGEKAITNAQVKGALVTHTPYANLLGVYNSRKEIFEITKNLIDKGYFPYTVDLGSDRAQLLVGAFYYKNDAINLKYELQNKGILTQVVLR